MPSGDKQNNNMVLRVHSNTVSFRGKAGLTLPGPWWLIMRTEDGSDCCGQKEELELSGTNMERDEHRNMTKNTDVSSPNPTDHREAKLPLSQYPKVTIKCFQRLEES